MGTELFRLQGFDLLDRAIEKRGLTSDDLAKKFAVARTTVDRWRRRQRRPRVEHRELIAQWLGVPVKTWLTERESQRERWLAGADATESGA